MSVTVINMNEPWAECCICFRECRLEYAVAYCCEPTHDEIGSQSTVYPGLEVGGMPACKKCHDEHYSLT
jgi:hypothetical protein